MAAHHLVPAAIWGEKIKIATLAYKAGWRVDDPSNLIGLPRDQKTQALIGGILPLHKGGGHPIYSKIVESAIDREVQKFPSPLTPFEARSILDAVALRFRIRILSGEFGPVLKTNK